MDKKKIAIYVVVIAAIVLVAILAAGSVKKTAAPVVGEQPSTGNQPGATNDTRQEVSGNVVVPSATSTDLPANVAKPMEVVSVRDGQSIRKFSITADKNTFTPSAVTIYKGDTMQIAITAVDKDYDFAQPDYGYSKGIAKGTTETIIFDGTAEGIFTFFCRSCGGPSQGPKGTVTVAPKK